METANFGKTNYHVSIMKLVMTDHQKQTVFLHQLPLFQAPLDRFFFFIFNAPYSCNFPGLSTSA